MPFVELENGQPIQMKIKDTKNLINTIYKNIEIPDKLYEEIVKNKNNLLRENLANNVIGTEIKKAFGNPPVTLKNSDDESYEITILDSTKLTPENIKKFNQSVNEKLQKVNDKLIVNEKVDKELTKANPSITKTQIEQYQNALSKIDPQYLKENINQVSDSLKYLHETTKLSLLEKIITTVKGENKEVYLAQKVGKLAAKAFVNKPDQVDKDNINNKNNTKTVLNQPTRNLAKTKAMLKAFENVSSITTPSKANLTPTSTPKIGTHRNQNDRGIG